jgi:hypothetical protein
LLPIEMMFQLPNISHVVVYDRNHPKLEYYISCQPVLVSIENFHCSKFVEVTKNPCTIKHTSGLHTRRLSASKSNSICIINQKQITFNTVQLDVFNTAPVPDAGEPSFVVFFAVKVVFVVAIVVFLLSSKNHDEPT